MKKRLIESEAIRLVVT